VLNPIQKFYSHAKKSVTKDSDVPNFFVFYLTIEMGQKYATVQNVRDCYYDCDLAPPSWLASHFSNGLKSKPRRFVRSEHGYRLEDKRREEIADLIGHNSNDDHTRVALNRLETHVAAGPKREFLHETIKCFEVGAHRAAVVMCWNLALHHLQDYVLGNASRLSSFNSVLALNKDGRVKIKTVEKPDDFTEMPESKFLLFCREAKLITSSIFKKLETRLDERNSAAHPSGVKVTPKSTEAYIEDLIENVIVKFST
jgi:hypothetical protein